MSFIHCFYEGLAFCVCRLLCCSWKKFINILYSCLFLSWCLFFYQNKSSHLSFQCSWNASNESSSWPCSYCSWGFKNVEIQRKRTWFILQWVYQKWLIRGQWCWLFCDSHFFSFFFLNFAAKDLAHYNWGRNNPAGSALSWRWSITLYSVGCLWFPHRKWRRSRLFPNSLQRQFFSTSDL